MQLRGIAVLCVVALASCNKPPPDGLDDVAAVASSGRIVETLTLPGGRTKTIEHARPPEAAAWLARYDDALRARGWKKKGERHTPSWCDGPYGTHDREAECHDALYERTGRYLKVLSSHPGGVPNAGRVVVELYADEAPPADADQFK